MCGGRKRLRRFMMKIYAPDGFKTFGVFCCLRRFSGRIFFIGRIHMIPPYDELTGQYEEEDKYEAFLDVF